MLTVNRAKLQTVQKPGLAVFKSALFTEHSNADNNKKTSTVADSVTSVGENGDLDHCLGASVASLGVNTRP